MHYRVNLSPQGKIRLWYDEDTCVDIPSSLIGLDVLREILQFAQLGKVKIGQEGAPTQAQIEHYVKVWRETHPEEVDLVEWEGIGI